MTNNSTIAALATAPAPAGIAVVRVSGPETRAVLKGLFRGKHDPVSQPRKLIFGDLLDYKTGHVIDHSLAVYMPGPNSFTGEDIGEFQFHGSPLVVQKLLRSLFAFGVVPAEPGEFTKRAFLNGKMDLAQAEAICDLINASSDQALKIAGEQLEGRFSRTVAAVGEPLRDIVAELEASLDFPEEGIEPQSLHTLKERCRGALHKVNELLATYSFGHIVRDGFRVLLCGKPNAGKSSLLNLLLGKERAIVTEVSGTTRDLIEEEALIHGFRFIFCDSAGLRDTEDKVEKIGVELAKEKIAWADLVLFVVDASDASSEWRDIVKSLRGRAKKIWMVTNKIDLNPNAFASYYCESDTCEQNFYLSVKTKDGFDALSDALLDEAKHSSPDQGEATVIVTNERHRNCLYQAQEALTQATQAIEQESPPEIVSAEVRRALKSLEEIVGATYTEDILGRIFSKFCIGK